MRRINKLVIILIVLLAISMSYIAVDKWKDFKKAELSKAYQEGFSNGYAGAITKIIQLASTCSQVPLYINNQTINIIAVECLRVNNSNR